MTTIHSEISAFNNDGLAANKEQLQELGAAAGDRVAVLGFPMNLAGLQRKYVIARFGAVARLSDLISGAASTFLIDCFVFPGNSGGPVVLLPDLNAIQDTKAITRAAVIGVLDSYVPYRDEAVSLQTHEPRVIFEENSGLAQVIPMDAVDATIEEAEAAFPPTANRSLSSGPQPAKVPAPRNH